jgi:hypothetical protein
VAQLISDYNTKNNRREVETGEIKITTDELLFG